MTDKTIDELFERFSKITADIIFLHSIKDDLFTIMKYSNTKDLSVFEKFYIINSIPLESQFSDFTDFKETQFYGYTLKNDLIDTKQKIMEILLKNESQYLYEIKRINDEYNTAIILVQEYPTTSPCPEIEPFRADINLYKKLNQLKIESLSTQNSLYLLVSISVIYLMIGAWILVKNPIQWFNAAAFSQTAILPIFLLLIIALNYITIIYSLGTRKNIIYHYLCIIVMLSATYFALSPIPQLISEIQLIGIGFLLLMLSHIRFVYRMILNSSVISRLDSKMDTFAKRFTD